MTKDVNIYSFYDECYVYLGDYRKLQQSNQHLLDLQKSMDKQYEELEDRIDKAINFIDQVIQFELLPFDYHKTDNHLSILIGILKGDYND